MATAMPDVAAQMPIAAARSVPWGKTTVMIARVAGKTRAANSPSTARAVMSCPSDCYMAASTETAVKPTMPVTSMRRWPKRSPR